MKNIRVQLLCLLLIIAAIPAFAEYVTVDGIKYSCDTETGTATVSRGVDCRGAVTIPESVTLDGVTYPVTRVGDKAFYVCNNITSIDFPDSVEEIGEYAFGKCTGLMSVTIPESMTRIGYAAFWECTSLIRVFISDLEAWCNITFSYNSNPLIYAHNLYLGGELVEDLQIPDGVNAIKNYAFSGCYIASVEIPSSVTTIGYGAFCNCKAMESLSMPESILSIAGEAFYGCISLESVTIGDSVTTIGKNAFDGCISMKSVTIGNSVSEIGIKAFSNCTGLKEVHISDLKAWCNIDFMEDGRSEFESNPLFNARNLYIGDELVTDLVIPDGIECVKKNSFAYCHSLRAVTIPASVKSISDYAFYDCLNVTSVTIGESVNYIGEEVFRNESYKSGNLTTVNCLGRTPPEIGGEYEYDKVDGVLQEVWFYYSPIPTYAVLHVPMGCRESYRSAPVWEDFKNIVADLPGEIEPNTVVVDGIQYRCDETTGKAEVIGWLEYGGDVVIRDSVTLDGESYTVISISNNVFAECGELTSVTISDSVIYIGALAFYGCDNLKSVKLGNSLKTMGKSAFAGCKALVSITIPNSVTSIGASAFKDCKSLSSIDIPDGVKSIGNEAFSGCCHLKSVTIGESVKSIGVSTFRNCSWLEELILGNGVKTIGSYAFEGCTELTSLTIPDAVTGIGTGAFAGCDRLESVTLGNSLMTIGDNAFAGCARLESVTFGESVKRIGKDAFEKCGSIREVHISDIAAWCVISFADYSSNPLIYYSSKLYLGDELLTDMVIPDGVKYIGDYVFNRCSDLTSVSIPRTVKSIGKSAFSSCGLETIICHAQVPPSCDCYYVDYNPDDYPSDFDFDYFKYSPFGSYLSSYSCDLYVPAASVDSYREEDVWKKFKNIMPIGTTSVIEISDSDDSVTITGNTISVDAKAGTPVNIYSIDGVLRYQGTGPAEVYLPSGIYILKVGSTTQRIRI